MSHSKFGLLPWRSRSQHDLSAKSCPAHNLVIWCQISQLFYIIDHHIDTTVARTRTLLFAVEFYNYFWQTTSLCPIPIRGALPGSDRHLFCNIFTCTDNYIWQFLIIAATKVSLLKYGWNVRCKQFWLKRYKHRIFKKNPFLLIYFALLTSKLISTHNSCEKTVFVIEKNWLQNAANQGEEAEQTPLSK